LHYVWNFKDGKRDGVFKRYYKNGQLKSECNWKDGKEHGLCKGYWENGQLKFEGHSEDGGVYDPWKFYDENGDVDKSRGDIFHRKFKSRKRID